VKNFTNVWGDIVNIIESNNEIKTLTYNNINKVIKITEDGLMVTTGKNNPELVKKEWIRDTWDVLVSKKAITKDDLPGKAIYRSSFIMALLSNLDYVRAESRPNKLFFDL